MFPLASLLFLAASTPSPGAGRPSGVEVIATYYRSWTQTAQVYLANRTTVPQELAATRVGGRLLATAVDGSREGNAAAWHRLCPNPIPPGGVGCLWINSIRVQGSPLAVAAAFRGGAVCTASIACEPPPMRIADVGFPEDYRCAYVFIRCEQAAAGTGVRRLFLDGKDVTQRCDLGLAAFHLGTALVAVRLPAPLRPGSMHVLRVVADAAEASAQVRVLAPRFALGTYGKDACSDYREHGLNTYLSFAAPGRRSLAGAAACGIAVGGTYVSGGGWQRHARRVELPDVQQSRLAIVEAASSPGLAYWTHGDEPDVADFYAGAPGRTARAVLAADALYRRFGSPIPTLLQIDNTFRNSNYHIYAEIPDIAATHRYSLGQDSTSPSVPSTFLAEERDALQELKRSAEPRPIWWVTQFLRVKQDGLYQGRLPDREEMRVQMLHALGAGAKGIVHYIHSGSATGADGGQDRALWNSMTALHRQVAAVARDAALGSPVAWAVASPSSVEAHAVLSANGTVLLVLVDTGIRSAPEGLAAQPVGPVDVAVTLPAALVPRGAELIGDNGDAQQVALEQRLGRWHLRVPQVAGTALIRLR